jgi:hypothetical protein
VCDEHKTFGCRNVGLGMIPGGKNLTEEKYEQAAVIRDKIKQMEAENNG